MRVVIFGMCALVAAGVFATMLLTVWSTSRATDDGHRFRQGAVIEIVWAAIPCLIIIAAALPAAIASIELAYRIRRRQQVLESTAGIAIGLCRGRISTHQEGDMSAVLLAVFND